MTITPICASSPNWCHQEGSTHRFSVCVMYVCYCAHNKTSFTKIGTEELVTWTEPWPQHLWNDLKHGLNYSPQPTSMANLTNAFVPERTQIPTASLHNLVENIPRLIEGYYNSKEGSKSWMRYWTCFCGCDGQGCTYFCKKGAKKKKVAENSFFFVVYLSKI